MHGRISRYSMATGSGVVTNYSKKIFELRKEHWHDRKLLPAAGMYVECRLDEQGNIVDAHSSAYQEFHAGALIKEMDFWKTDTDEELRAKEHDLRNQIAEEIFKQTNYLDMTSIEASTSVKDCLKEYFTQESNALKFSLTDLEEVSPQNQLNYLIIRRFLSKAMDFLMYCDKNVTKDIFSHDLQKLSTLEYSYKTLAQSININPQAIYEEVFLEKQLHYRGAIKAILGIKEKLIQLRNKARFCMNEVRKFRNQIEAGKNDPTLPAKLETQKAIMLKSEEEIKILTECKERLEEITKTFRDQFINSFSETFQAMRSHLAEQTRSALNLVATALDNKMWKIGMASTSVHNSFFKHDINNPYCTMTFYGQYLKRLDKNKLANNEKTGYNYFHKYKKQHEKLFLIYTTNQKLEMHVKLQIMSASKEYSVVIAKTDGEFLAHVNTMAFEIGYIDPFIRGNPTQLIEDAKTSRYNKNTRFVIISQKQATDLAQ